MVSFCSISSTSFKLVKYLVCDQLTVASPLEAADNL